MGLSRSGREGARTRQRGHRLHLGSEKAQDRGRIAGAACGALPHAPACEQRTHASDADVPGPAGNGRPCGAVGTMSGRRSSSLSSTQREAARRQPTVLTKCSGTVTRRVRRGAGRALRLCARRRSLSGKGDRGGQIARHPTGLSEAPGPSTHGCWGGPGGGEEGRPLALLERFRFIAAFFSSFCAALRTKRPSGRGKGRKASSDQNGGERWGGAAPNSEKRGRK